MLSYQHEYHAGNHADILKHTCLLAILRSLCKKEKPFTVMESHSGAGRFRLDDERLVKTGEAEEGIISLMTRHPDEMPPALRDYLNLEKAYYARGLYAGSPEIERLCLREKDALHLAEKHPAALASLSENARLPLLEAGSGDSARTAERRCPVRADIREADGYAMLKALCPPPVRRGLVMIDPSYEDAEDYTHVRDAVETVMSKWNTAIIAVWYPLLVRRKNETAQLLSSLEDYSKMQAVPKETVRIQAAVHSADDMAEEAGSHLYGSGMFIVNPPWQLAEQMEAVVEYMEAFA
ncbi:MAG: 23S rRNA (adenine(2030)-N(6))-methyltransferase RlmJ [Treponema sp.]|nr:23S rRNA (adenine(2030)-N(6))-methyltransferase RlmJ [Treponema sp.]